MCYCCDDGLGTNEKKKGGAGRGEKGWGVKGWGLPRGLGEVRRRQDRCRGAVKNSGPREDAPFYQLLNMDDLYSAYAAASGRGALGDGEPDGRA